MIEQKYIELINKKIDGEITPSESVKLQDYLSRRQEAEQVHDELMATSTLLSKMHEVEPPSNLKKKILNEIRPDLYNVPQKTSLWNAIKNLIGVDFGASSHRLKYGFSFVFGLAAGLFIYSVFANNTLDEKGSVEITDLYGTIMQREASTRFTQADKASINLPQVSGTVSIKYSENLLFTELFLRASQKIDLVLEYDENLLVLNSFAKSNIDESNTLTANVNSLKLSEVGEGKYAFVFNRKTPVAVSMRFKIYSASNLLYEKSLEAAVSDE